MHLIPFVEKPLQLIIIEKQMMVLLPHPYLVKEFS